MTASGERQSETGPEPLGSAPTDPAPGWLRQYRLAGALTATGYTARRFRSLGWSAALLALGGVASVALVSTLGAKDIADIVALRVMAYACWLYGALGLWAVLSPKALDQEPSLLAKMRGHRLDSHSIRAVAIAKRLSAGMLLAALPGLVTAMIVSPTPMALAQRIGLLVVASVYLCSLGAVLGVIGGFSTYVAPRAPRTAAAAIVLVPFAVSFAAPNVPSVVGIYSWALGAMIEWGAS